MLKLRTVILKKPVVTADSTSEGKDGRTWYVWSDNTDEQTLTCLPYPRTDEHSFFVCDLQTFDYDAVLHMPDVLDVVERTTWTVNGLIEVAVPSNDAVSVAEACKAGLLQMIGNGLASITPAGRRLYPG